MRWDDPKAEGSDPWPQKDNQGHDVIIRKNARPQSIAYECEQSLKRLKTDVIDLYQIHWPDVSTPVEDSIRAMDKLRKEGKIRAVGVSNYDREWMRKASDTAQIDSLQPPYSLMRRKLETDVLPLCIERHIGVIVYSPMERGLLTGKISPDRQFAPGDHRVKLPQFSVESRKCVSDALEKVKPIADKHNASFAQLVINWTFSQSGITGAIVGARNAEQAAHNAGAMRFTLNDVELAEVRRAFDGLQIS
jgi:aryl-alcohol dehydrogenase-like predicted oxidoreductase